MNFPLPFQNHLAWMLCFGLLGFGALPSGTASAATPGDTTWVRAHDARDLVWNEAYDAYGEFPDASTSYGRILLYFTLGCASSGCSDWDYTVLLSLVDTATSTEYELGRCITPYGGYMRNGLKGFNNNWTRTFVYDVTDFAGLLQDRQKLRIYYDGWSSGFAGTMDFAFIEGTPPRPVLSVSSVYHSGASDWNYSNSADFESAYLPARTLAMPVGTSSARLRVTPSGHGFDNTDFCAEFCERDYSVRINGTERFRQSMWREDCGYNPVYPQAGTWLYDRANWCPGAEAWTHFHEYTPESGAASVALDLDIDAYSWSGPQTPSYLLDASWVCYGAFNHILDAELLDILSPSTETEHARFNPSCGRPLVRIGNNGSEPLTSCTIAYGIVGGTVCYQPWSGNLLYGESEEVALNNISWPDAGSLSPRFFARVEGPNGSSDEVAWNNEKQTRFDRVPVYENSFVVWMRTNARPDQNAWTIRNDLGEVVASRTVFDGPFLLHEDTVYLPDGCYHFQLTDQAKDGLEFFANADGTGILRFARTSGGFLASFSADFGTQLDHNFTTGLEQGGVNSSESCEVTGLPDDVGGMGIAALTLLIYPNPARESLMVEWITAQPSAGLQITLRNLAGATVWQRAFDVDQGGPLRIALDGLVPGLYVLDAWSGGQRARQLVAIEY